MLLFHQPTMRILILRLVRFYYILSRDSCEILIIHEEQLALLCYYIV